MCWFINIYHQHQGNIYTNVYFITTEYNHILTPRHVVGGDTYP